MPSQSCTAGTPHSTEDIPTRNPILVSSIAESPKRQSNRYQKRGRKTREVDVFSPSPSLSTPSSSSSSSPSSPTPSRDSRRRFPMSIPKKPILKPFFLIFLSFFLFFHLFLSSKKAPDSPSSSAAATATATTPPLIRIRPGFRSYDDYIKLQLNKTLNPRLRRVWATRDWDRKVRVFARFFSEFKAEGLLTNASVALCVGARLGQEVAALRGLGVAGALGMDLVPAPPLVVAGDFHAQPFPDDYFDFEFSNVFDHALYPERFVAEVERTLRPGGVAVLHVAVHRRGDKYSANDLLGGVDGLVSLFKRSELVRVRKVDGFGLDTEVVLRKKQTEKMKKKNK